MYLGIGWKTEEKERGVFVMKREEMSLCIENERAEFVISRTQVTQIPKYPKNVISQEFVF